MVKRGETSIGEHEGPELPAAERAHRPQAHGHTEQRQRQRRTQHAHALQPDQQRAPGASLMRRVVRVLHGRQYASA